MAPEPSLKLRAEDVDDLAVISACVQDALISVGDLTFDRDARTFTVVANRFRWEGKPGDGELPHQRTLCAVTFSTVDKVTYRGFRRRAGGDILSLLAIRPGGAPGTVELQFSGGAAVRLGVSAIAVRAVDIGEPWPTAWQPDHDTDTPS